MGLANRLGPSEDRIGPPHVLRREVGGSGPGIVPRHQGDVGDLLERLQPGLARLQLHEVQQLHLPVQDEVMDPHDDRARCSIGRRAHDRWAARACSMATSTSPRVDSGNS